MAFTFKERSTQPEILDDFDLEGNDLEENLRELEVVGRYLGGYKIVFKGIRKIIESENLSQKIRVVDVGCGGGDMLVALSKWGSQKNLKLELIGLDANPSAVAYARKATQAFENIQIRQCNVFSDEFTMVKGDIIMFNLVLHHFTGDEIVQILTNCRKTGAALLINDLQRSVLAYQLFRGVTRLLGFSYIGRHDGKLSIKKSFTKKDWKDLLTKAGIKEFDISWQWAFRYLVLVR